MAVWLTLLVAVRVLDLGILDVSLVSSLVDATTTDTGHSAHFRGFDVVNVNESKDSCGELRDFAKEVFLRLLLGGVPGSLLNINLMTSIVPHYP